MTKGEQKLKRDVARAANEKKDRKFKAMFADNIRTMPVNDDYEEGFKHIFGERDIFNRPIVHTGTTDCSCYKCRMAHTTTSKTDE